ncbi:MAG: hypothetical protein EXQ58_12255 [Acidobacteria bacterium]|nr:hypothetical protein [Acidobacteriota bacterium]
MKQSMQNLGAVLKAARLGFSDVVNSNVYLTDIKNFQAMNKVYKTISLKSLQRARQLLFPPCQAVPTSRLRSSLRATRRGNTFIRPV